MNPDLNVELDSEPEFPTAYAFCSKREDGKWVWVVTLGKKLIAENTHKGMRIREWDGYTFTAHDDWMNQIRSDIIACKTFEELEKCDRSMAGVSQLGHLAPYQYDELARAIRERAWYIGQVSTYPKRFPDLFGEKVDGLK
ncbi:MAG: hypothetical protein V4563_14180 [Pseudomonadota bacterium]